MIKNLSLLIIFFSLINCKKEVLAKTNSDIMINETPETKYGKKFFDYDEIDAYQIETKEDEIKDLYENQDKSKIDKFKYTVIVNETPENLKDLTFLKYMDKIGYSKKKINSLQFKEIDKIFVEKAEDPGAVAACIPVFRDILIFKKDSKVVGIVKICFACHQYRIIGTDADIKNFGSDNDYGKLGEILDNNSNE